jgi:acyl-[acyl carrier protein]--UDP-N-acetylglucosamine O-acyltransferase
MTPFIDVIATIQNESFQALLMNKLKRKGFSRDLTVALNPLVFAAVVSQDERSQSCASQSSKRAEVKYLVTQTQHSSKSRLQCDLGMHFGMEKGARYPI